MKQTEAVAPARGQTAGIAAIADAVPKISPTIYHAPEDSVKTSVFPMRQQSAAACTCGTRPDEPATAAAVPNH